MILVTSTEDLNLLKDMLSKELPESYNVHGGVAHMLYNNACRLQICVDAWPMFTTVICFRKNECFSSDPADSLRDMCTFFSKNPESLRRLLNDERVVNWRSRFIFRDVLNRHVPLVKELIASHGFDSLDSAVCYVYLFPEVERTDPLDLSLLPISTLKESDAGIVTDNAFDGIFEETYNLTRAYIRHLPNFCVRNEEGQPVSWLITDDICALRMAYSLPEYREKGYFKVLSYGLIQKMAYEGLPLYCLVRVENKRSHDIVSASGFEICHSMGTSTALITCIDRKSKSNL